MADEHSDAVNVSENDAIHVTCIAFDGLKQYLMICLVCWIFVCFKQSSLL